MADVCDHINDHLLGQPTNGDQLQRFIDPHFHFWDLTDPHEPPAHCPVALGLPGKTHAQYLADEFTRDMDLSSCGFALDATVFVEALPNQPVRESQWVSEMNLPWVKGIVGYAYLPAEDIEEVLRGHSQFPKVRGIRQILNHHPTNPKLVWPKVRSPDYLTKDAAFRRGYALLQKHNFTYDLHVNPHQLKDAAAFIYNFREIPVVLDHLGCLNLSDCDKHEAEQRIAVWREGMLAIAQQPHTNLKVSGLCSVRSEWAKPESPHYAEVKELALEMIRLFGSDRCMFASNFPVDNAFGTPACAMYKAFADYCKDLTEQDRDNLFHATASRFYRL